MNKFKIDSYLTLSQFLSITFLPAGSAIISTIILTDPAIHSTMPGFYGFTDHGEAGINKFFKTHQCGNLCTQIGLNNQLP